MSELIDRAITIASLAHSGQKRKADGSPYIAHPMRVAMMLARHRFSDAVVAAACVHDVLEDTDYGEKRLKSELGVKVVSIVKAVTNDDSLEWKAKKLRYIASVKGGPEGAKAVACADKIDNMRSFVEAYHIQGDVLWGKFNGGKEGLIWYWLELLKMLKASWKHPLLADYELILKEVAGVSCDRTRKGKKRLK
jgi:(p)ppGpp synthase/HD superfamily hydrolase